MSQSHPLQMIAEQKLLEKNEKIDKIDGRDRIKTEEYQ